MSNAKVVIIEENNEVKLDLKDLLEDLDYHVIDTISTVDNADEVVFKEKPDLLILDIVFDKQPQGIDFVKKIRERDEDLPVIYLSREEEDHLNSFAEETHPLAIIHKPVQKRQLLSILRTSFKKFKLQKERLNRLLNETEMQKQNIMELSETNAHLITATFRERELKKELQKTKEIIEVQNRKIIDSINYARRIQTSIAPSNELMSSVFENYFLFYKPKDVVSGDFPWMYIHDDYVYFAAVDCTGHGVPGAMMSMIGNLLLNDVVHSESTVKTPSEVLLGLHQGVVKTLKQDVEGNNASDGMDISICRLKKDFSELTFAGAHLPLYLLRNGELTVFKGSPFPVGGMHYRNRNKYKNNEIEIQKGDRIFLFSDGLIDQIGGEENKKLMSTGLQEFILQNASKSMEDFGKITEEMFENWRGGNKQIDDVILLGIEI